MKKTQMEKIHETLFILYKCTSTFERLYNAYEQHREKGIVHSFVHYSHNLYYYTIMEAVSLLDEYDSFFTEANVEDDYKQRVRDVRKIVKPIYKKIREWKDLKTYRNKVIAHGWRDEKGLTIPHRKHYDVPRTLFELQLLKDLLKLLYAFIEAEFKTEINSAIFHGYHGDDEDEERMQRDYNNINSELEVMCNQINETMKELGKNYEIQMTNYRWLEKNEAK